MRVTTGSRESRSTRNSATVQLAIAMPKLSTEIFRAGDGSTSQLRDLQRTAPGSDDRGLLLSQ
jgi:hypothetical protein